MTTPASFRSMVAESQAHGAEEIAGHPVEAYWFLLAPHFRDVLLLPHRPIGAAATLWTWDEPGVGQSVTAPELVELRQRLQRGAVSLAEAAEWATGDEARQRLLVELATHLTAIVARLTALPDARLARWACRTPQGLMLHSWGEREPGTPRAAEPLHASAPHPQVQPERGVRRRRFLSSRRARRGWCWALLSLLLLLGIGGWIAQGSRGGSPPAVPDGPPQASPTVETPPKAARLPSAPPDEAKAVEPGRVATSQTTVAPAPSPRAHERPTHSADGASAKPAEWGESFEARSAAPGVASASGALAPAGGTIGGPASGLGALAGPSGDSSPATAGFPAVATGRSAGADASHSAATSAPGARSGQPDEPQALPATAGDPAGPPPVAPAPAAPPALRTRAPPPPSPEAAPPTEPRAPLQSPHHDQTEPSARDEPFTGEGQVAEPVANKPLPYNQLRSVAFDLADEERPAFEPSAPADGQELAIAWEDLPPPAAPASPPAALVSAAGPLAPAAAPPRSPRLTVTQSPWTWRSQRDPILPTQPRPLGFPDSLAALRQQARQQLAAAQPSDPLRPTVRTGLTVTFASDGAASTLEWEAPRLRPAFPVGAEGSRVATIPMLTGSPNHPAGADGARLVWLVEIESSAGPASERTWAWEVEAQPFAAPASPVPVTRATGSRLEFQLPLDTPATPFRVRGLDVAAGWVLECQLMLAVGDDH